MQTTSEIPSRTSEDQNRQFSARAKERTERRQRELQQLRWSQSASLGSVGNSTFTTVAAPSSAEPHADLPTPQRIVNGTATSSFKSVGLVGSRNGFFCSGTLIGARYVLTAGHCGQGVGNTAGRFKIGGKTYSTRRVYVHPNYNARTLANDVAIYELDRDVVGIAPSRIFRGTPQVGQTLTLVGFGAGGNGTSGHNNDFATKRVGTTPIDEVTAKLIEWNFDNNNESNTAPGDSGGPAFLRVNGVYYVAGITSGGDKPNAGIGDHSFDTRVDAFQTWIDAIIKRGSGGARDDHANQINSQATVLAVNAEQHGKLETKGDRDVFRVEFARAGTAVFKSVADGKLDTFLRVYDAAGKLLAQNDDFGGGFVSQAKLNVNAARYYVSVGSYRDAGTGGYTASVRQTSTADDYPSAFALTHRVRWDDRGRQRLLGTIETGDDADLLHVTAAATARMRAFVRNRAGNTDTTSGDCAPRLMHNIPPAVFELAKSLPTTNQKPVEGSLGTAAIGLSLPPRTVTPRASIGPALTLRENAFLDTALPRTAAASLAKQRDLPGAGSDASMCDSRSSYLLAANPAGSPVSTLLGMN